MFIALLVILPNLLSAQRTHSIDTDGDGVYDQYTVNDGITVYNDDWLLSKNSFIMTMTLKIGKTIAANLFSSIGFSINRGLDAPTQTNQSITAKIVNGSLGDREVFNNTLSTIVKVQ